MERFLRTADDWMASRPSLAPLFLRVGLATVFLYAAVASLASPDDWVSYLPHILRDNFSADILLKIFAVYELALAAWLLSGVHVRWAGLVSAATLLGIVTSNFSLFIVTFRDIGLACAALALAFSAERK